MDGVIVDLHSYWLGEIEKLFGVRYFMADLIDSKIYADDLGHWILKNLERDKNPYFIRNGAEKTLHKIFSPLCKENIWMDAEPIPLAIDTIKQLSDLGHEIIICSTPYYGCKTCYNLKADWLDKYLTNVPLSFIATRHKHHVNGDYFIDDAIKNIEAMYDNGTAQTITYVQPWNFRKHNTHHIGSSWFSIKEIIQNNLISPTHNSQQRIYAGC